MWKCTYIETSAKNNFNIEAVFKEILTLEQKRQLELRVEDEKVLIFVPETYFNSENCVKFWILLKYTIVLILGQEKEETLLHIMKI